MSGMPLAQALVLLAAAVVLVVATRSRHLHPFLAIVLVASTFGLAVGLSLAQVSKAFGLGFAQAIAGPGLVIVGAGFVGAIAESTAAAVWLAACLGGQRDKRRWFGSSGAAALLGVVAGIGATPSAAFAVLTPLLRAIGEGAARQRETTAIVPALAISASHGLLLVSPVAIAAAAILDAPWGLLALLGPPLTLLATATAMGLVRALAVDAAAPRAPVAEDPAALLEKHGGRSAATLLAATVIPVVLLIVQSVGDIPSEPLGGGTSRELVLGVGRPLVLFLVALGIMTVGLWRLTSKLLADSAWTARVLGQVAGVLLTVGAAGGLQRLCQETGMAELLGERLAAWPLAGASALVVPFAVAAAIKCLQGSSLVAAITAAGIVQPLLPSLGLGGEAARALAALAVGAGAMTAAHVNDEFFWLVSGSAGLRPLGGLATITLGTLLQGAVALAALIVLAAVLT
jgi:gluconate:H+ symporter, GntP family